MTETPLAPQSPAPQSPAPQSPAPQSPAPQSPAPQSLAPQPLAPQPLAPLPIAFLFLDDRTCSRCRESGAVLDQAVAAVAPALAALGVAPAVERRHVASAAEARTLGFVASPTIRVDGLDIQPDAVLSPCRECGDLCGCADGVDCRAWSWRGERLATVPIDLVVGALLAAALARAGLATATPEAAAATRAPDGGAAIGRFFAARAGQALDRPNADTVADGETAIEAPPSDAACGCAPSCCGRTSA